MKKKIISKNTRESDYLFFWQVASAYNALSMTAVDPVTLHTDFRMYADKSVNARNTFGRIYWDCHDDEMFAKAVMTERIQNASQDIIDHLTIHLSLLDTCTKIQNALRQNNRETVVEKTNNLCTALRAYGKLAKKHQDKREANAFLSYPAGGEGHLFYRKDVSCIRSLQWNTPRTYEGNECSVQALEQALHGFQRGNKDIADVFISYIQNQDVLRDNVRTNILLLDHAGLKNIPQRMKTIFMGKWLH